MKTHAIIPTGPSVSIRILLVFVTLITCRLSPAQPNDFRSVEYEQISNFETSYNIVAMKISGDGSKIVFSTGGPFVKVFTINTDGTGLTEIYDFQRTGTGPFVDIDETGEKVIWCDGKGEIFIANSDGTARLELATLIPNPDPPFVDIEPVIPLPPRITASGTQVYFINMVPDSRVSGPWRVNSDGSSLTQIFNYARVSSDIFGRDGSEYNYNTAFADGFDISDDGSRMIFGTRIFKLEEGDLGRGHAIVADGTTLYPAGEYATGRQPFATSQDGAGYIMYRREFNQELGFDEINVYFTSIGTGDPVKVIGGLDIFGTSAHTQMALEGSRAITFAANGKMPITLAHRPSASRWDLVSVDVVSIAMGGYRFSQSTLPSITKNGDRFCFLSTANPAQIWVASINSDAITSQPSITDIQFNPDFLHTDGSTRSTISAHVTHLENTIHTVSFEAFRDGAYQFRAIISDWPYWGKLLDNGTNGDPTAGDRYFTNNTVRVDLTDTPPGTYAIRIAAVDATLREITMVDASPFFILEPGTSAADPH